MDQHTIDTDSLRVSDGFIKTSCRLCYNGCGVVVRVENGRPVSLRGDPAHPLSRGALCPRGRTALEIMDHPGRLRHPLLRTGRRGAGEWTRISWDEALERTTKALTDLRERWGAQTVAFMRGGSKGSSDDYLSRLANVFGSPNVSTTSSICYSPSGLASKHTYGFWAYPDMGYPPKCVLLWGANPRATHPPLQRELDEAVKAGAKLIVIDPRRIMRRADVTLRPRPGADGLLAMAMAQVIVAEGLHDREFLSRWAVGFGRLRAHLEDYAPERVAEATWIPAEEIRRAARLYATTRPGCILWGNAFESGPDNYQTCRAICILRALTGNIGAPGGDILWSGEGELRRRDPAFTRPDLLPEASASLRLGRLAGLLPDFSYAPHTMVARAILDETPYPVRGAFLLGGNLLCTSPDSQLMAQALAKLEFLAATDLFMTPTTALADIVFPASMYLEHDGVEQPWHWPAAFIQQRAAHPGDTRSEQRLCNDLCRLLGTGEHAFSTMRDSLDFYLEPAGVTFEQFRSTGVIYGPGRPLAHEREGFPTPSGKVELYSSFLEAHGFPPLPTFVGPPTLSREYPLVLTNLKLPGFYHSFGRQLPSLRTRRPDPTVRLHPATAADHDLNAGAMARIVTAKGAIRQKVVLDDGLLPGVVMAEHGWWFPEEGPSTNHGWRRANMNMLTDADGSCGLELGGAALRGIPCNIGPCPDTEEDAAS